ncbi:unnamed protein product, partial [Oikopleura dioica]
DGRTETIRSCTTASAAFVKEMLDKNSDNQKRRNALKAAVTNHSELTKHAMVGEAVDRHLFALCVASRGLNMEHEFLNKYRNAKWENVSGWELSTRILMMKKEEEKFVKEKEKKGFDHVWERLPHISFYQFWITTFPSVSSLMGGFMSIYPVFAQYKPPYRCQNGLDRAELSPNFSFQEISELTTETLFCKGFQPNQLGGCFFCDFSDELIQKCNSSSFSALKSCFGTSAQQNSTWRACDDYEYDRGIRNNVTNFRGEKWGNGRD